MVRGSAGRLVMARGGMAPLQMDSTTEKGSFLELPTKISQDVHATLNTGLYTATLFIYFSGGVLYTIFTYFTCTTYFT